MLIMQAKELNEGDKVRDIVHNEDVSFLAGPFQNLNEAVWHIVGRDEQGVVKLYHLSNISSVVMPEAGETWKDSFDAFAHVDAVANGYVVFRHRRSDTKEMATVMTLRKFVSTFYKA
ncbi:hypothetical protein SEA_ANNADREAMY_239 [Streptomyces phage Annadreamy]|uniref:Uncharacterized protein n=2 Tax=Annadreamyvirus annadreamy TaxID=2846392 RepID=A0A345GTP7_9CAUD|nr:hypothetical protein HWB75_gp040 [Streptomyces phage Annadreamy]AXG66319.1 hypothetical protein SEA_ANNADREAMY_239 [Streptomyces phage Annadreamy]QGH79546.1 hypothetical protein SEA_LIMPID_245 [Streptomyces phage Limpid]